MSYVVKGIEWVATHHSLRVTDYLTSLKTSKPSKKPNSAANMSLGGGKSRALDLAVDAAVEEGVHFAVAAGNDDRDACNYSPAASEKAITDSLLAQQQSPMIVLGSQTGESVLTSLLLAMKFSLLGLDQQPLQTPSLVLQWLLLTLLVLSQVTCLEQIGKILNRWNLKRN